MKICAKTHKLQFSLNFAIFLSNFCGGWHTLKIRHVPCFGKSIWVVRFFLFMARLSCGGPLGHALGFALAVNCLLAAPL